MSRTHLRNGKTARAWRAASTASLLVLAFGMGSPASAQFDPYWERVYYGMTSNSLQMIYAGGVNGSMPALGDIDGDSDPDLFIGGDGTWPTFMRNDGTPYAPRWTFVAADYAFGLPGDSPSGASAVVLSDWDGDGLQDAIMGRGWEGITYHRNTGNAVVPQWNSPPAVWLGPTFQNVRPAVVDIDGDSMPDLFVGYVNGTLKFWNHSEVGSSPSPFPATDTIDVGDDACPSFCDIDADGDYDLFVGNRIGRIQFFENTGTSSTAQYILRNDQFAGVQVDARAAPAFSIATTSSTERFRRPTTLAPSCLMVIASASLTDSGLSVWSFIRATRP